MPLWTDAERAACVAFWDEPGRMSVSLAPPRVVLTPEASVWFYAFNHALRTASPTDAAAWKAWTDARLAQDRWEAASVCGSPPEGTAPLSPGVIPTTLLSAVGDPPPLAAAAVPRHYTISLGSDDGPPLTYDAPISMAKRAAAYRSAYYRSDDGVVSDGTSLKALPLGELDSLMRSAGLTPSEIPVMKAVSQLEGGFDAVNTYDTGWVSVGFIQFITAAGGNGSLAGVLASEKAAQPSAFARDFHIRGIDVTPGGIFAVVDPATGAELKGPDAVRETIRDPRLVAVFQAAGRRSTEFRVAQIQMAKQGYWAADDPITVTLADGTTLTGRISDVLKSGAGLATAFDRKVNTGHAAPEVAAAVGSVMAAHNLRTLSEVAPYEREVVTALRYRADFLADPTLTQPTAVPPATPPAP
jgi:hypothetical protein